MKTNLITLLSFASAISIGLVACAPTPAPTSAPVATVAPAPTAAPAATVAAPATAAPAAKAPVPAGAVTLKIVEGESNAQYEVNETLFNENNKLATAIGVTPKVNGEIQLNPQDPGKSKVGRITVDVSLLKSEGNPNGNGSPRRDGFIMRTALESSKYPIAEFTPKTYEGLPATYKTGDTLKFKMSGDMKVHETVTPVTWDVEAAYDGSTLKGKATTAVKMSMFGFQPPNIAGMLRAEDDTKLALVFVAKP